MGTIVPIDLSPLQIEYPANDQWTIYGRSGSYIYAQPHFLSYPLFVPILLQGDFPAYIGVEAIPDGFIRTSLQGKARCYNYLLKVLTNISEDKTHQFELKYKFTQFNGYVINIHLADQDYGIDNTDSSSVAIGKRISNGIRYEINQVVKFEDATCSLVVLKNMWGFSSQDSKTKLKTEIDMPAIMPLEMLRIKAWLHDTVVLVSIEGQGDTMYAFKTNNTPNDVYQELHTLLCIPPHPNIVERPYYLVTKKTQYSQQNPMDPASLYLREPTQPIIGFLMPYYSGGSLKAYVKNYRPTPLQQSRWALQLTAAILHIYEHGGDGHGRCGKYSALKMDNIVLDGAGNIRLIDFENSGTWLQYTPIEVITANRASKGSISRYVDGSCSSNRTPGSAPVPVSPVVRCTVCSPHPCHVPRSLGLTGRLLEAAHEKISEHKFSHTNIIGPSRPNSNASYNGIACHKKIAFWSDASNSECSDAMAWMLGCCLWCIFEGEPCLSDVGDDWFPVYNSIWKKARRSVPPAVLKVVGKTMRAGGERPELREIYDVLVEWEGAVRRLTDGVCGTDGTVGTN